MQPLLYLVHRIPYPPNKGDKIRSYHLLQYLAQHFDIYLGAFVDDPGDWRYEGALRSICKDVCLRPLNSGKAKLKSLRGLGTGDALTLPYYRDRQMQDWVDNRISAQSISQCVIFSSAMAQYVSGASYKQINRIADFVDVDSDKWRQYSSSHRFPMNWLYRREAGKLAGFEAKIAYEFDAVFFVSEDELGVFKKAVGDGTGDKASQRAGQGQAALDYYHNGVDDGYFDPSRGFETPYEPGDKVMVFTGAMDYWANVDAVKWFAEEVMPLICESQPTAKFYIVGANPGEDVRALAKIKNVHVTGMVQDIRPYIRHAHFAVAPLRIARGVQNKVLEAMAMSRQVVATPAALEGIEHCDKYQPAVAEDAKQFVEACLELLHTSQEEVGAPAARECIQHQYNWERNLSRVAHYLGVERRSETSPGKIPLFFREREEGRG